MKISQENIKVKVVTQSLNYTMQRDLISVDHIQYANLHFSTPHDLPIKHPSVLLHAEWPTQ